MLRQSDSVTNYRLHLVVLINSLTKAYGAFYVIIHMGLSFWMAEIIWSLYQMFMVDCCEIVLKNLGV